MIKKTNNTIAILFILIGITITVGLLLFAYSVGSKTENLFNKDKAVKATILYENVKALQKDSDYPKTPEEVLQLYNDSYLLLYGNMIKNKDIISEILHQQRKLYSKELLKLNAFEEQEDLLEKSIEYCYKNKFHITGIITKPVIYDMESNTCYIRVTLQGNDFSEYYWNYFLEKERDTGFWKITAWKKADKNFNSLE